MVFAMLASLGVSHRAAAQQSAADFNRQEWMRQNGAFNLFGGPKVSPPPARRAAPSEREQRDQRSRRQQQPQPQPQQTARREPPAQDFFSALFGGFASHSNSAPDTTERARITITPGGRDAGSGSGRQGGRNTEQSYSGGGTYAFCVRTCDGRYFPLQGRPYGAGDPNAAAQCAAFCPAATTEVFVSASSERGIEEASNKNGKAYTSLPTAFAFRERIVEGCSCRADGKVAGIGRINVMNDPTLKRGDIVMTADGARIFTGERSRPPFREGDFVAPKRFPELPVSMRQRIAELTVL